MLYSIEHKLGNFALALGFEVSEAGVKKAIELGLKKATDAGASKFFVDAKGKAVKNRRESHLYSAASADTLKAKLTAAYATLFGEGVTLATYASSARAWTDEEAKLQAVKDAWEAELAAYARYQKGVASGALEELVVRDLTGYSGPATGPVKPAALQASAAPATVSAKADTESVEDEAPPQD